MGFGKCDWLDLLERRGVVYDCVGGKVKLFLGFFFKTSCSVMILWLLWTIKFQKSNFIQPLHLDPNFHPGEKISFIECQGQVAIFRVLLWIVTC